MAVPVDSADSAALGARVPEEPPAPVRARLVLAPLVLAREPVLADLLLRLAVRVPAHLAVPVQRPVPADPLLAQRPVPADPLLAQRLALAHWVLGRAAPVDLLLSRQSF